MHLQKITTHPSSKFEAKAVVGFDFAALRSTGLALAPIGHFGSSQEHSSFSQEPREPPAPFVET